MPAKKQDAIERVSAPAEGGQTIAPHMTKELQDVPNYYANQASVRTTQHDVQIIHCQIVAQESGKLTVVPQAVIYMSLSHAKKVANIIVEQVAKYEEKFGVVIAAS